MLVTKHLPKNEGVTMNEKELLSKLGIEEPTEAMVSLLEDFAKSQTKGIEESMQKRINSLTKEKHELSGQISDLKANAELFNDEKTKFQKQLDELSTKSVQFDEFQKQQRAKMDDKWKQALEKLNVPETDKRYDNIQRLKARLTLKDKPDEYSPEEIEKNLEIYEIYADAGAIDKIDASGTPSPPPSGGTTPSPPPKGGLVSRAADKLTGKPPKP